MIRKALLPIIILSLLLTGCSERKQENQSTPSSTESTQQAGANQQNIRSEIKANIDKLKDYDMINIEHMTKGIEEPQKYEPESPKEFNAGMFKVTFQKVQQNDKGTSIDQVSVVCQTESKVGHLAKVVPGKTVVDGFIFYAGNADIADIADIPNQINDNLKFTKDEEKYFIEHLYGRFEKKMTQSQANWVNETKDLALAIYFNGNKGIEQFHQEQKEALNKKSLFTG
jgi:hypothetical protein